MSSTVSAVAISRTPEYRAWQNAKQRCRNSHSPDFPAYGGRGIEVRISLVDLLDEIGVRPGPDFSLDRVDNDGHYESGNLRWASRKTQARNRRGRRFFQARNKIPQAIKGQVVEMLFDGVGYRDIARSTGVSRLSVIRIAQANNLADRKRGRKTD